MFVILWIKENKYYAYTKENHWTDNIEAAGRFNTLEAAQKYAKNGLKDKLHELQYLTLDGREELDKFATQLYWKAQNLIDEANSLESKADAIRVYLAATEREEVL